MNKITITLNDKNQVEIKTQGPLTFEELIQITQTVILGQANSIIDKVPNDEKTEAKEALYDMMNQAFSRTLEFFAPEFEVNPGLTAQAILEKENEIIERQYQEYLKKKNAPVDK